MTQTNIFYIIVALVLIAMLVISTQSIRKSENKFKKSIIRPIVSSIIAIVFYTAFLNSKTRTLATLFDGLYFVMTDWLAMFMFFFIMDFTGFGKKRLTALWYTLASIDSVSLIINTWTFHSFSLELTELKSGAMYWSCTFTPLHWVHLGFCYVMVFTSFIMLIVQIVKLPWFYKQSSLNLCISYFIVIVANFVCYMLDTTIDFSVLLYSILATIVSIYSVYSAPQQLITQSITQVQKSIQEGIVYFNSRGNCIYRNNAAKKLFDSNEKADEYRHMWLRDKNLLKSKDDANLNFEGLDTGYIVNESSLRFDVTHKEISKNNHVFGYIMIFRDRTEEINQFLHDRYIATHDSLTGIYNREHFFEVCDKFLKSDMSQKWVMICSNIKDFKLINDYFGAAIADKILIEHAKLFRELSHKENVYGRIGDDRFAIMIKKEYLRESVFLNAIDRIKQITDNGAYKMHFYAGVYEIPENTENSQTAYDKAMLSINSIKGDYQETFAYYDSKIMEKILAEKNIVSDFENALIKSQIEPYIQPVFDANGKCLGGEILSRWHHPERGLLLPETFIEILNHTNLIHKLDLFIWEKAAAILSEWKEKGFNDMSLSINASSWDIYYLNIQEVIKGFIDKYKFDPSNLVLEFTEDILTQESEKTIKLFQDLQEMGIKVGIDGFGRGYSSLNLLKDIRVDILKIDLVFLDDTEDQKRSDVILKFVNSLSDSLNMHVIAEGVENVEQMNLLKNMGTSAFQGFYFSRAIPKQSFEEKYLH